MINCIIVDDECYASDTLSDYITKAGALNLLKTFSSPTQALKEINAGLVPDLIFLDIDMPELSGLDLAGLLPQQTAIIYVTGHAGYALSAFETNAYDFLLKPVSFTKFLKSVQKVTQRMEVRSDIPSPADDFIFINPGVKSKLIKLQYKEIISIQGLKNYVIIFTGTGKHITYLTMKEMELALPREKFIRIHKSYIVNTAHIQKIEGNMINLSDNQSLPLGGSYKDELMQYVTKKSVISRR